MLWGLTVNQANLKAREQRVVSNAEAEHIAHERAGNNSDAFESRHGPLADAAVT